MNMSFVIGNDNENKDIAGTQDAGRQDPRTSDIIRHDTSPDPGVNARNLLSITH